MHRGAELLKLEKQAKQQVEEWEYKAQSAWIQLCNAQRLVLELEVDHDLSRERAKSAHNELREVREQIEEFLAEPEG